MLNISEASYILGVSEAALRQWTDEGKISAFITPGGHRRYSKTDLRKFMSSPHKSLDIKDLVVELEDTVQHRKIFGEVLNSTSWYKNLDAESQEHLAYLGRHLLNLIIKYITGSSKREEAINTARDIGQGFGEILAKLRLPLTDSVEAFILHRNPIMNATTQLMRKREALTGRVVEAIPKVAQVMDETLVSLVATHQRYQETLQDKITGGASE